MIALVVVEEFLTTEFTQWPIITCPMARAKRMLEGVEKGTFPPSGCYLLTRVRVSHIVGKASGVLMDTILGGHTMQSLTLRRINASVYLRVIAVSLFVVITAISARVSIPLPFSPVPLTLQVLAVILTGLVLGPWNGLIAQCLYLQAILLGVPATSAGLAGPGAFVSPTAGYLLAFPLAAWLAGWLGQRKDTLKAVWRVLGGLAAMGCIYIGGMLWLGHFVGGLSEAWKLGVLPFIGVDALKVVVAASLLSLRDR
jgi:biotin transport system substrate-specific component